MASPEWFFSTLAQSSAAIIGFVLAFSAVLHQLERQQREKRTDGLRDELIDLKQKYRSVFLAIRDLLAANTDRSILEYTGQIFVDPMDRTLRFPKDESFQNPQTTKTWFLSHRIVRWFDQIDASENPEEDYLLNQVEFANFRYVSEELEVVFRELGEEHEELINELNPGHSLDGNNETYIRMFGDVQGAELDDLSIRESPDLEDLVEFQENKITVIRDWLDEWLPDRKESVVDGANITSLRGIFNEYWKDYQKVDSHRNNTLIDYEPVVSKNIIRASGFLALTGVFIPIGLLLTVPSGVQYVLTEWTLALIEFTVLVLSLISTGYLLYIILRNLDDTWTGLGLFSRGRAVEK